MKSLFKIIAVIIVVVILISSSYLAYVILVEEQEANKPPSPPSDYYPSQNATGIPRSLTLRWVCEDPDGDNITYDVYFGLNHPPAKVSSNQSSNTYKPQHLTYDTTYYWQIIAWDEKGLSSSTPILEFKTIGNRAPYKPTNPSPSDNTLDVSINTWLKWSGVDPDGDSLTYDVYFDVNYPPSIRAKNHSGITYNPGVLLYNTTYYWSVTARDENGAENSSGIWSFKTSINKTKNETPVYQHTVFVEEGTAGWCTNCPAISKILDEIYKSGKYRFYYVSLVHDQSSIAERRLKEDYNIEGFPVVFIDGGYNILYGGNVSKSEMENAISKASSRVTPKIILDINANWDNTTKKLKVTVTIKNDEAYKYTGRLKVHLVDEISPWFDYNGLPYKYSLKEYIIDKNITVNAKSSYNDSVTKSYTDIHPDNLVVIAVLFSSESSLRYSNPPSNTKEFKAYYADATAATNVIKGENRTLPPLVGIEYPKKLRINILGRAKRMSPFKRNTIIIGRTTVSAYASSLDSNITKVEFYVDDALKYTDTSAPYTWTFRKIGYIKHFVRRHTIMVKAYDAKGMTSTTSIDVLAFLV
ncbi:MAG: Ig-like domain-containing protein [Candidatus Thermoplasmatota archaeon]